MHISCGSSYRILEGGEVREGRERERERGRGRGRGGGGGREGEGEGERGEGEGEGGGREGERERERGREGGWLKVAVCVEHDVTYNVRAKNRRCIRAIDCMQHIKMYVHQAANTITTQVK